SLRRAVTAVTPSPYTTLFRSISRVPPYSRTCIRITHTGLSPTMAQLSRRFRFSHASHWPGPRSLATTNGVSVDVLSYGYLDVSVPPVRLLSLCIQNKIPFNTWKPEPPLDPVNGQW